MTKPSRADRFFRNFAPIFGPPFAGLWLVILLYYAWCFLIIPDSQVLRGNFPDPDDYMYLVQVMDWLKGGGWYDNIQHRINPPDGVMIHFSRLAQIPMAAMVWLFELCGLGPRGGSMLMALTYPLILLGGFFVSMKWAARSFLPRDWTGVTAYVALFSTALMYMFQPGHVDHHGLMIMVIALTMGCALRMMENPADARWGFAAGAILALGQTLALEILPWLLLISAWLGIWAIVKGRAAARNGLAFGLALYVGSVLCLLVARPPSTAFLTTDVLTYSIVYVYLAGGIAVCFAGVALAGAAPLKIRLLSGGALGVLTGFLFLYRFPELATGPYGAMDPELQDIMLDTVNEAMPLAARFHSHLLLLTYLSATLLALGANIYFLYKAAKEERWLWGLQFTLLLAAFLLTTFYQCRYGGTMGMLTIIPLAVLLHRGWFWAKAHLTGRKKVFAEIGLLLLVGPLLSVLLPALQDGRSFNTGILLFPVSSPQRDSCDTYILEQVLRDPVRFGTTPKLIVNDMGLGPELLFRTQDNILAAPFLDTLGNLDANRFFSTPYPQEAENIARRRHVDLVVACVLVPMSYLRKTVTDADTTVTRDFAPHFIESLIRGRPPDWLKRVKVPSLRNFVIYEVQPPKPAAPKK